MAKIFKLKHFYSGFTRAEAESLQKTIPTFRSDARSKNNYEQFWKTLRKRQRCRAAAKIKCTTRKMKAEQKRMRTTRSVYVRKGKRYASKIL